MLIPSKITLIKELGMFLLYYLIKKFLINTLKKITIIRIKEELELQIEVVLKVVSSNNNRLLHQFI